MSTEKSRNVPTGLVETFLLLKKLLKGMEYGRKIKIFPMLFPRPATDSRDLHIDPHAEVVNTVENGRIAIAVIERQAVLRAFAQGQRHG